MLAPVPQRDLPGAVDDHAVLDHVRIGAAVLLDVVGVEHDHADRAVAGIGRVAVRVGVGVGRVDREAVPPPARQLDLGHVQLPRPAVLRDVHESPVGGEGQPCEVGIVVDVEGDGAGRKRVVVAVHQQLPHGGADVAEAQAEVAGQLALQGQVVLVDVGALQVGIDALVAE